MIGHDHPQLGLRLPLALAAVLSAALLAAVTATRGSAADPPPAYTDCPAMEASQPFAPWGDTSDYVEVPNGSFDQGLAGWTVLSKPEVVQVVQTPDINGETGPSLQVGKGARVLSPPMCFDETRPHAKLFARPIDGKANEKSLKVKVVYPEYPKGNLKDEDVVDLATPQNTAWGPTAELSTALERKKILPDEFGNRIFQLELESHGRGSWQIDDLYLDPRARY